MLRINTETHDEELTGRYESPQISSQCRARWNRLAREFFWREIRWNF